MKRIIVRISFSIIFTIALTSLSAMNVYAESSPVVVEQDDPQCEECHGALYAAWEFSKHGLAVVDPYFSDAWTAKGEPNECLACHTTGYNPVDGTWEQDGVTCQACHSPYTADHPSKPMPVDRSSDLCGTCHTNTFFEWQVSQHGQEKIDCISCHGQHSTSLRGENPSELCASCHGTRASNFTHSEHYTEGLSCADCHLGATGDEPGSGHGSYDHAFNVSLKLCSECHDYLVHNPEEFPVDELPLENLEVILSGVSGELAVDPQPVGPLGFATLSGMIGLAVGVVTAPWLENWYRKLNQAPGEKSSEKEE